MSLTKSPRKRILPKSSQPTKTFVFKASWRSTAMTLKIQAKSLKQATVRAWGTVSKMQGGMDCLSITFIEQESK